MVIALFFFITRDFWGIFITAPDPVIPATVGTVSEVYSSPTPQVLVEGINVAGQASSTPYPTYTIPPTQTPVVNWLRGTAMATRQAFDVSQVNFVFSYYWPPLVALGVRDGIDYTVNCHPDNWVYNDYGKVKGCKDTTNSGQPWSHWQYGASWDNYYRGGIAVPYYPDTLDPLYPMGTVFTVDAPAEMAGNYMVVDICPGCDNYYADKGVLFIDFLADGLPRGINFWTPIHVSQVFYPNDVILTATLAPSLTSTVTFTPYPTFVQITQVPDTVTPTVTPTVDPGAVTPSPP